MKTGRGILGIAALIAATLPAAGCSTACPAIGYVSGLEVIVEGDVAAVDEVQLCTDEGCSAPGPTAAPAPSVAVTDHWVQLPNGGFSPAPGPSVPPPTYPDTRYIGNRAGDNTWKFTFILGPVPTNITLRALADGGSVVAEQENDLEWSREVPFNPCPGPISTPPVVFMVGER
ncbi:hypothetical protein M8J71_20475 [Pseudarthrobacter sp. R1]|uniref:hypothetical protein n=1 Tax=Pseudarthrobacter sp. R1 TaxID=2944934 RepID=UPI00210A539B|nr:hypothetical protein [Pseudarthrobacter sp. R1]MCQ6272837.1 hypothetical protein [Pseudarthrobacter sp. R1]